MKKRIKVWVTIDKNENIIRDVETNKEKPVVVMSWLKVVPGILEIEI